MSDMDKYNDGNDQNKSRNEMDAVNSGEHGREDEYEEICYICRRPESVAGKMIHIPNNICICKDCMQRTFDSMAGWGMPNPGNHGKDDGNGQGNQTGGFDFSKMPNISMINLSDLGNLGGFMPNNQRIKKKKKKIRC